jgi:hypothetical protein
MNKYALRIERYALGLIKMLYYSFGVFLTFGQPISFFFGSNNGLIMNDLFPCFWASFALWWILHGLLFGAFSPILLADNYPITAYLTEGIISLAAYFIMHDLIVRQSSAIFYRLEFEWMKSVINAWGKGYLIFGLPSWLEAILIIMLGSFSLGMVRLKWVWVG